MITMAIAAGSDGIDAFDGVFGVERAASSTDTSTATSNVSITANAVPEYVLVTSADFWNEQVEVNYFQWRSSGQEYEREDAGSRSEPPVSIVDSNQVPCSS